MQMEDINPSTNWWIAMAFIEMLIYVQFKKNIYLTLSIRNEKYDKNNLLFFSYPVSTICKYEEGTTLYFSLENL